MKLLYIGVLKKQENPPPDKKYAHELVSEKNTSSFSRFLRGYYEEGLTTTAKIFAQASEPGKSKAVNESIQGITYRIVIYGRAEGVCAVAITDEDYPPLPAQMLLSKILTEFLVKYPVSTFRDTIKDGSFTFPELKAYIVKYQDPEEAEPILKIQKDLDLTTNIMRENIIKAAERGEGLDELNDKTSKLLVEAGEMFKTAKKQNSCCASM